MIVQGNIMTDQRATNLLFPLRDKHENVLKKGGWHLSEILVYHHMRTIN